MKYILVFCLISGVLFSKEAESVFAVHEHELREGVSAEAYERDVSRALSEMEIPGLLKAYLIKGFKGEREGRYAVIWIFESPQVIENHFGTFENPKWPAQWLHYENVVLAPYLDRHPDKITFTDYNLLTGHSYQEK